MDLFIAAFMLVLGILGIFFPHFFYKAKLLTPQQIARNNRVLKRMGVTLIPLALILFFIELVIQR